jgi:hypothetical protein
LNYTQGVRSTIDVGRFPDDQSAIEHTRRAMEAPYLRDWLSVTITRHGWGLDEEVIGTWVRKAEGLAWHPAVAPSSI